MYVYTKDVMATIADTLCVLAVCCYNINTPVVDQRVAHFRFERYQTS